MKNKRIFLLTLLIILMASLTAISATNLQDNDTSAATTTQEQTTTITSNDNTIQTDDIQEPVKTINKAAQSKTKQASTTTNNYEELYNTLTSSSEEIVSVSLDGEEKYTITQPITLSNAIKNLTIEGNGRIIDGNKQHSFLNIPQECKLTINKLTIQNCIPETTIDNDVTGAIITNGGKILLNNTKMINNTGKWGAALTVFNKPSQSEDAPETSLTVTDSIFESNYASAGGSAIYSVGCNVTIENTTFTKNFGLEEGALYYNGTANTTLNIRDSSFDSNSGTKEIYDELEDKTYNVTSNAGAAVIYSLGNTNISNTEFKNNIGGDRGALYYRDMIILT